MALDSQLSQLQVGQQVPYILNSSIANGIQTNTTQLVSVGLILQLTPLISDDGKVVIIVQAQKSQVGPEAEGIPIQISATGTVLRSPRIDIIQANTTVSAMSGQTILLGGLISTNKTDVHRRVPLIADVPLIGDLFRYDSVGEERRELLIIITPRIVKNEEDAERLKQIESSRMSWILNDVVALNGPSGLKSRCDNWGDGEVDAVYPNYVPQNGELCPTCQPGEMMYQGPSMQTPTPMLQPLPAGSQPNVIPPPPPTQPASGDMTSAGRTATTSVTQARYQATGTSTRRPPRRRLACRQRGCRRCDNAARRAGIRNQQIQFSTEWKQGARRQKYPRSDT